MGLLREHREPSSAEKGNFRPAFLLYDLKMRTHSLVSDPPSARPPSPSFASPGGAAKIVYENRCPGPYHVTSCGRSFIPLHYLLPYVFYQILLHSISFVYSHASLRPLPSTAHTCPYRSSLVMILSEVSHKYRVTQIQSGTNTLNIDGLPPPPP